MQLNHEYARVINGELDYAPMRPNPCQLTPTTSAQYLAAGYYPLAHNQPLAAAADGHHWEHANWQVVDNQIVEDWTQVADAPAVHTYSKLRLLAALTSRGLWAAFKAFVESVQLTDAWQLAQDLSSDYEGFAEVAEQARLALGVDADTLAAILAEAEVTNG